MNNMVEKKEDERIQLIEKINQLIELEIKNNPVSYNKDKAYQSYERIGFEGLRWSVEKRITEYGLERFFNKNHTVLDIGSNFGFFVCEFALYCKLVHGIEPNSYLIEIGNLTADFLGVSDKVGFYDCLFENFETDVKYDTILSLAAFFTADGRERTTAMDYFSKVNDLLNPDGILFYESTSYSLKSAYGHYIASNEAVKAISEIMDIEKEWETPSGSKDYYRKFVIAKKRK